MIEFAFLAWLFFVSVIEFFNLFKSFDVHGLTLIVLEGLYLFYFPWLVCLILLGDLYSFFVVGLLFVVILGRNLIVTCCSRFSYQTFLYLGIRFLPFLVRVRFVIALIGSFFRRVLIEFCLIFRSKIAFLLNFRCFLALYFLCLLSGHYVEFYSYK